MISFVTGFGPEIPNDAYKVVENLERDISDLDNFIKKRKGGFSVIVVSFVVINPTRGIIPNSVSLKRFSRELWSTWNLDFSVFLGSSDDERRQLLKEGACRAIALLEGKYLEGEDVRRLVESIAQA